MLKHNNNKKKVWHFKQILSLRFYSALALVLSIEDSADSQSRSFVSRGLIKLARTEEQSVLTALAAAHTHTHRIN